MKKLLFILGFILLFTMLFVACEKTKDTVSITTDIKLYTPYMSSKQGITMTPNFKSNKKYNKLEYHWISERGSFILFETYKKDLKNQGEAVLWSAIENDKVAYIKESFDIQLEIIDSENKVILTKTKIAINIDNGFYGVEEQK
jgi:hypothetical protein